MTTVSTNTTAHVGSNILQVASVIMSALCFVYFWDNFVHNGNPMGPHMMIGYALAILTAIPAIWSPSNVISAAYSFAMTIMAVLAAGAGIILTLPWIMGVIVLSSTSGYDDPYALSVVLWGPLYFGLPALVVYLARRD